MHLAFASACMMRSFREGPISYSPVGGLQSSFTAVSGTLTIVDSFAGQARVQTSGKRRSGGTFSAMLRTQLRFNATDGAY